MKQEEEEAAVVILVLHLLLWGFLCLVYLLKSQWA